MRTNQTRHRRWGSRLCTAAVVITAGILASNTPAQPVSGRLLEGVDGAGRAAGVDWLVHEVPARAVVHRSEDGRRLVLSNGVVARTFLLAPNAATIGLDNLMTGQAVLRAVKPEAVIEIDGTRWDIGGLTGQPDHAYLDPAWVQELRDSPAAFHFTGYAVAEPEERMAWKQVRHRAPDVVWPPRGVSLRMDYAPPAPSTAEQAGTGTIPQGVGVSVHYVLYDGIPVICKWISVRNGSDRAITVDRCTSELLAAVEPASYVGGAAERLPTPNFHVETDYSFGGGMAAAGANEHVVRWTADPEYATQVNYQKQTPCLLEVGPATGPAQVIEPGGTFESVRTWELIYDSTDRERNGLALRRMYRTVAPWVTENPIMMHVRFADWETVRNAIDQCAEVGFEMVILTFGSGFNVEDDSAENLAQMTRYAEYAASKGIEIGGYSLLASRSIGAADDVVSPEGRRPMFGNSPCLGSEWGLDYFRKLRRFYGQTGFMLLEHDGSYPGDVCASEAHPGHRGLDDSQWTQWRTITDFYRWCRGRGVYLNVPDWYYLAGSNKCGMGYRETNWSLPRAQQVIHTRQNNYDGTWEKTPSMGWMFVPLTQYHGGGAAATIEPLAEHLDHYGMMLAGNLAHGVQACYRGPRLYDTDETKAVVRQWVDWFKDYRDILESDMIHGRRADGRDLDWMLHVNPRLRDRAMLVVFNPTEQRIDRTLSVNLYYAGLTDRTVAHGEGAEPRELTLARDYTVEVPVSVPAGRMTWMIFRQP